MLDIGMQELIIIFIVALIVFGPKRLPELGRTIGKGISELKKALHGVKEQIDTEFEMVQKSAEGSYPEPKKNNTIYAEDSETDKKKDVQENKERKDDKVNE